MAEAIAAYVRGTVIGVREDDQGVWLDVKIREKGERVDEEMLGFIGKPVEVVIRRQMLNDPWYKPLHGVENG